MTGLLPFILAMMRTPDDRLVRADVTKLAAKYDIPVDHARFYLSHWMGR